MAVSHSSTMREAGTSQPARRRLSRRLSASHVLIAVVVILAFVLNLLVLQDRSSTVLVAVAEEPISVGSPFDTSSIRLVPIDARFEGLTALLHEGNLDEFEGHVFTKSVEAGSPVGIGSLGAKASVAGLRVMSLPVPVEHAAGGTLETGDSVDVISVGEPGAEFVATGLDVVGVAQPSGGVGSIAGYHVVVAVTSSQALALAEAMDAGDIELLKATGALPLVDGEDTVGS